jgi:uncharacterized membrane protein
VINSLTIFKFLHIVSVIVWVGGGVMMQALAARAFKAGPEQTVHYAQDAAWTGNRVFMPASLATLIFGFGLVGVGHYPWKLWLILGLVGFALTAINGAAVLGRLSKQLAKLVDERGPSDPVVQYTARRLRRAMAVDLVIVLLVVFDMVAKPGL